jgi:hypothetical protein
LCSHEEGVRRHIGFSVDVSGPIRAMQEICDGEHGNGCTVSLCCGQHTSDERGRWKWTSAVMDKNQISLCCTYTSQGRVPPSFPSLDEAKLIRGWLKNLSHAIHVFFAYNDNKVVNLRQSRECLDAVADHRLCANRNEGLARSCSQAAPTPSGEDHGACGHGVDVLRDDSFRKLKVTGSMA